jgi:hypothetical protein
MLPSAFAFRVQPPMWVSLLRLSLRQLVLSNRRMWAVLDVCVIGSYAMLPSAFVFPVQPSMWVSLLRPQGTQ